MPRPTSQDAAPFFQRYINYATGNSVKEIITNHSKELIDFFNNLPEEKAGYAYAPGKWTIKQVLQHVTDAERIFTYRALRIARKDITPLAGFEENDYAENDGTGNRSLQSIKDEFNAVRLATDILFNNFTDAQLSEAGTASNNHITVNGLAFITYGHLLHHKKILEERYL